MKTDEKILRRALELFNENGVEYVGLRELAADLGIRVGNITYYFPTKDDLIHTLSNRLRDVNSRTIGKTEGLGMLEFLQMMRQIFINQYGFRCLLLSMVHLFKQNVYLAASYHQTEIRRKKSMARHLQYLSRQGYIKAGKSEQALMLSHLSLLVRFWISEASISLSDKAETEVINHYLRLMAGYFHRVALKKGKQEINTFLLQLED